MPLDNKIVPAGYAVTEFTDHNSRFIANAGPAFSIDEARAFSSQVEQKYPNASHNVPVYIIGHGQSTTAHCSDAGEPSGTAGRPALAVLQGSGIGDVVVVITRYYGGTNLGTGGLVRAYSDSVREVLKALPLARKVATTTLMFVIPYSLYEQVLLVVKSLNGLIVDEDFAVDITLSVRLDDGVVGVFKEKMVTLAHGQVEFIIIDQNENTLQPL